MSIPSLKTGLRTISIIVPFHNRPMMVRDIVASIAQQDYPAIELILVDDGSDAPEDLSTQVMALGNVGIPIQVLNKPHGGVASARNFGIAHSSGDYIAFLDSDDLYFPTAMSTMIAVAEESGADYCIGQVIDTDFALDRLPTLARSESATTILHAAQWSTHAALYRRATILAAAPFDESLRVGEDMIFQAKMILQHGRGVRVPHVIGVRRLHDYGHLSTLGNDATHEARYIHAMATVIAQHDAFRRESYGARLFWTSSYLQRMLALRNGRENMAANDLLGSLGNIASALLHDAPRLRHMLQWLVARDRPVVSQLVRHTLTTVRWAIRTRTKILLQRNRREDNVIQNKLQQLRNTLGSG